MSISAEFEDLKSDKNLLLNKEVVLDGVNLGSTELQAYLYNLFGDELNFANEKLNIFSNGSSTSKNVDENFVLDYKASENLVLEKNKCLILQNVSEINESVNIVVPSDSNNTVLPETSFYDENVNDLVVNSNNDVNVNLCTNAGVNLDQCVNNCEEFQFFNDKVSGHVDANLKNFSTNTSANEGRQSENYEIEEDLRELMNWVDKSLNCDIGAPCQYVNCIICTNYEENVNFEENLDFEFTNCLENNSSNLSKKVNIGIASLKNKVTVLPQQKVLVELTCKSNVFENICNDVVLEPLATKLHTGILASRAICSKFHGLFVSLINFSDYPVTLNKGMRICKIIKCKNESEFKNTENEIFCGHVNSETPMPDFDHADLKWSTDINLDHLNGELKARMQEFLEKNKDVFAASVLDLPGCNTIPHVIQLHDNKPVKCRAYRVPYNLRQEMDDQLDILLQANIIEPSMSEFASPVLLVKKSDGSYRLAVDYRKLNKQMVKDAYPLPNITDSVDALAGSEFFSTLDLTSGFFQQVIKPEDRHKTAIVTHKGQFSFSRTPFGLCNSPPSFQRLMNAIFGDLGSLGILVYIDDIVIASKDIESHLEKLNLVFERLRQHNLKLKPSKCTFLSTKIKYLGFQIENGKLSPINKNIEVLQKFKYPNSRKAVRSFIGTLSFYRKFLPDFTKRAKNLINLTKDNGKFVWTPEAQAEFDDLKAALVSKPCLALPDFSKQFYLYTDASGSALGAVLSQMDENNFPHPVAFASRKLKDAETRYSTTEREMLALVWATAHFKCYLANVHFTIFTDHAPLTFVLKIHDPTSRIARWICTLADFDFDIKYIQGKCNTVADFLSRFVHNSPDFVNISPVNVNFCMQNVQKDELKPESELLNDIKLLQKSDQKCIKIVNRLEKGLDLSPGYMRFFLRDDMLVCEDTRQSLVLKNSIKLVVPKAMVPQVFALTHESLAACHMGFYKTMLRIREHFYWPGMSAHVKNLVDSCVSCQQRRAHRAKHLAPLQRMPTPEAPMSTVHCDCIGPLPLTMSGNKYIVAYIDSFSKWPEAYAVSSINSDVIADTLSDFVSRYGFPTRLVTDKGSNFVSAAMEKVYEKFGIKHISTTPFHPSADGQAERQNRTLINALSHIVDENQLDWDTKLKFALLAMRTAVHASTNFSPAAIMYGRNLHLPYDLFNYTPNFSYNDTPSFCELLIPALQKVYSQVYSNLVNVAEKQEKYRERSSVVKNIKVGSQVWLFTPSFKKGLAKKLSKFNSGPFTVLKKLSDVNFVIAREENLSKTQVVHVDRLSLATNRFDFPQVECNQANDAPLEETGPMPKEKSSNTPAQEIPSRGNLKFVFKKKKPRYWVMGKGQSFRQNNESRNVEVNNSQELVTEQVEVAQVGNVTENSNIMEVIETVASGSVNILSEESNVLIPDINPVESVQGDLVSSVNVETVEKKKVKRKSRIPIPATETPYTLRERKKVNYEV